MVTDTVVETSDHSRSEESTGPKRSLLHLDPFPPSPGVGRTFRVLGPSGGRGEDPTLLWSRSTQKRPPVRQSPLFPYLVSDMGIGIVDLVPGVGIY